MLVMINRIYLLAATAIVLTLSSARVSFAQTVSYDFAVDIISGPFADERYMGVTSVDLDSLSENTSEKAGTTRSPTSILFNFGSVEFTEVNDIQSVDVDSPRVNFQPNGSFLGITYVVSRFGERSTEIPPIDGVLIDGFAIDNNDFGYVVGEDLNRGTVGYTLTNSDEIDNIPAPQPVSEPSFWLGLAAVGYWLSRRAT